MKQSDEFQESDPSMTWRNTFDNIEIPAIQFRNTVIEKPKEKLKDESDETLLISDKINPQASKFPAKSSVYHKEHGYLEVKKLLANGKYQLSFKDK